jgi:hypothetical protein
MNCLILLVGGVSTTVILWILLAYTSGFDGVPPGNATGPDERPCDPSKLLPIQYDEKIGQRLQTEHEQVLNKLCISLREARQLCHAMREHNSAIIELNVAKITLDETAGIEHIGEEELEERRRYIEDAFRRAEWFIRSDAKRYPACIGDYLRTLQTRLGELTHFDG